MFTKNRKELKKTAICVASAIFILQSCPMLCEALESDEALLNQQNNQPGYFTKLNTFDLTQKPKTGILMTKNEIYSQIFRELPGDIWQVTKDEDVQKIIRATKIVISLISCVLPYSGLDIIGD